MQKHINRRDFLKMAGLFSLNLAAPQLFFRPGAQDSESRQNVLIVVFDAFSAAHIALYGYGRNTTPNLARIIENGTVYHRHYANGPFTTPGTASLLTSTLPWTHRALDHNDEVAGTMVNKSIFHAFDDYHCMAYSHNPLVNTLLKQFLPAIDDYIPQAQFFLEHDPILDGLLDNDDTASVAWTRIIKQGSDGYSYSLLLSRLYALMKQRRVKNYERVFPRGVPNTYEDTYYILEHGIDGLQALISTAPQPFMGYFHFLPPHHPYSTQVEFYNQFLHDGYKPPEKPDHIFANKRSEGKMDELRRWYDEYILYVDSEFARLYDEMALSGLLDNTWLILTSDHGEMFERGMTGHQMPPMFEPLVHIPLVVFAPGQDSRVDIYEKTSAIDLIPTLMHVTGHQIPAWVEGDVLPPYASLPNDRPIISLRGWGIEEGKSIHKGSATLIRDGFKLVYIFGFYKDLNDGELIELYHLDDDPEELNDLAATHSEIVERMLAELKAGLERVG